MFVNFLALALAIAGATFYVIGKIKKFAEAGGNKLAIWLQGWFKGWHVEVSTFVVGLLTGLGIKAIILLGGLQWLIAQGIPVQGFESVTWAGYAIAGAISGFTSAIGVKIFSLPAKKEELIG